MMTYAAPAGLSSQKTEMERLKTVQNRALRLIGGYFYHTRIEKMHLDFKMPRHKT